MGFWTVAIAMTVLSGAAMLVGLLRAPGADRQGADNPDLVVYRDQLREVERDLARGVIAADEAARLRLEVSHRVLEADRKARSGGAVAQPSRTSSLLIALAVVVVLSGTLAVYRQIGAPLYPDLPLAGRIATIEAARAARPSQAEAQAAAPARTAPPQDPAYLALVEKLRAALVSRPDDTAGLALLAQNEATLGNFAAAAAAQSRVIARLGPAATAQQHADLAELLIEAAGGYVAPEAEAALTRALQDDAANPTARYYSGLMFAQAGRPDLAFRLWRPLLDTSAPGDLWVAPLRSMLPDIAARAGVRYSLPPIAAANGASPGPGAAEVDAAAAMTPQQRTEMIGAMVAGLAERLATEGGSATDWARLIAAYAVLGERDKAARIWAEAQSVFAAAPTDLAVIRAAALQAGLSK